MLYDPVQNPNSLPPERLQFFLNNADRFAAQCATFNDVVYFLVGIDTTEHRFDDSFGYVARFDAVCDRYKAVKDG